MTLIVAAVADNFAVHASDRLTTTDPTKVNPTGEFDAHSNKTVVAMGTDCWVVIGYTGLAFLDGKPTDQVIAEAISGYDDLSGGAAFTYWQRPTGLHYRAIRDRIQAKLGDAYSRLSAAERKRPLALLCAGLQRQDHMVGKVMFRMTFHGDSAKSSENPPPPGVGGFNIDAAGMVNNDIISRARDRILAISDASTIAQQVREILRDAVLETSALTNKVGDDVMTVVLDNAGQRISTLLHISDPDRQAALFRTVAKGADFVNPDVIAAVSTPYVLTPGMIYGPSIGNPGGWQSNGGPVLEFNGFGDHPTPPPGSGMIFSAQPRRQWP